MRRLRPAPPAPRALAALAALVLLALLAACRGAVPATDFYTLTALAPQARPAQDAPSVGVGPLTMPRMLDRPHIVTRGPGGALHMDEFHRWGGTLESAMLRTTTQNLAALLGSDGVVAYPWTGFIDPDYRVPLDVQRLDGALGQAVTLEVTWGVIPRGERHAVLVRRSVLSEPTDGGDYPALVAAHDRLLEALAREVAQAIAALRAAGR